MKNICLVSVNTCYPAPRPRKSWRTFHIFLFKLCALGAPGGRSDLSPVSGPVQLSPVPEADLLPPPKHGAPLAEDRQRPLRPTAERPHGVTRRSTRVRKPKPRVRKSDPARVSLSHYF
ncbi:hypothetical protein EYF80_052830 [Liparis tanakae]|uniref:Uncharacterized protein n=1 Tax=Liparis tanakae TaxID=230148 RepID=A0A4Z2F7X1_9TELE|nr:hypothetical protein EYF80_052830 [Liparis tanakae]